MPHHSELSWLANHQVKLSEWFVLNRIQVGLHLGYGALLLTPLVPQDTHMGAAHDVFGSQRLCGTKSIK